MGYKNQTPQERLKQGDKVVEIPDLDLTSETNQTTNDESIAAQRSVLLDNGQNASTKEVEQVQGDGNPGSDITDTGANLQDGSGGNSPTHDVDELKPTTSREIGRQVSDGITAHDQRDEIKPEEVQKEQGWSLENRLKAMRDEYAASNDKAKAKAKTRQKLQLMGDALKLVGEYGGMTAGSSIEKREDNPYLKQALEAPDKLDAEMRAYNAQLSNMGIRMGYEEVNRKIDNDRRTKEFEASLAEAAKRREQAQANSDRDFDQTEAQNAIGNKLKEDQLKASKVGIDAEANYKNAIASQYRANADLIKARTVDLLKDKSLTVTGIGKIENIELADRDWLEATGRATLGIGEMDLEDMGIKPGSDSEKYFFINETVNQIVAQNSEAMKDMSQEEKIQFIEDYIKMQSRANINNDQSVNPEQRVNKLDDLDL